MVKIIRLMGSESCPECADSLEMIRGDEDAQVVGASCFVGYSVPVLIRTQAELKEITNWEPFDRPAILGADVNIILLAHNLDKKSKAKLIALTTETDGFRVQGREIYWWRRKKPGTSLYSTVPFATVLSEPFTVRSINTIRRLVAKWP